MQKISYKYWEIPYAGIVSDDIIKSYLDMRTTRLRRALDICLVLFSCKEKDPRREAEGLILLEIPYGQD